MSDADSSKSPVPEVVGVDAPLNGFWPSRPADFRGQPRRCPPNSRSITVALLPPSSPCARPKGHPGHPPGQAPLPLVCRAAGAPGRTRARLNWRTGGPTGTGPRRGNGGRLVRPDDPAPIHTARCCDRTVHPERRPPSAHAGQVKYTEQPLADMPSPRTSLTTQTRAQLQTMTRRSPR